MEEKIKKIKTEKGVSSTIPENPRFPLIVITILRYFGDVAFTLLDKKDDLSYL